MAKVFSIVKKKNQLTGEERIVHYSLGDDELSRAKIVRKLNRSLKNETESFRCDERLYMHLLPDLSDETVKELSRRLYHTVYVVCKKSRKGERALYLSLFKDTAMRFKEAIPAATVKVKGKEFSNPDYYVKELRLCL